MSPISVVGSFGVEMMSQSPAYQKAFGGSRIAGVLQRRVGRLGVYQDSGADSGCDAGLPSSGDHEQPPNVSTPHYWTERNNALLIAWSYIHWNIRPARTTTLKQHVDLCSKCSTTMLVGR